MMCVASEPAINEIFDPAVLVKKLQKEISHLKNELAMHDTLVEAFKQKHLEPSETAPSSTTEEDVPPPPSPPQGKPVVLPPNWKTAIDAEGKMYYYHTVTRQTQWDPPTLDQGDYDEMDLGTPSQEEIITKDIYCAS